MSSKDLEPGSNAMAAREQMQQLASRYVPSTSVGTLLSQKELGALRSWLWEGAEGPAIVIAPPGVGLTTAVRLVVAELEFESIWLSQGHADVKTLIERAATGVIAVTGKRKVIVVDDFDASNTLLVGLLSSMSPPPPPDPKRPTTKQRAPPSAAPRRPPVLCIGHVARHSKIFEGVTRKWPCFKFSRPRVKLLVERVRHIADKERIDIDDHRIDQMCRDAKCDIRSVLNAIEMLALKKPSQPRPSGEGEEFVKDAFEDGMDVVDLIVRGEVRTVAECARLTSMDTSVVTMGVYENYINAVRDVGDCVAICDTMSAANLFDKRAHYKQAWELLDYHSTLSTGCVALRARSRAAGATVKPEKFGVVWSNISIQSAKMKNYRAVAQAMQVAGLPRPDITDLAYMRAMVGRATTDRDEAAFRGVARGLNAPTVLALMRLWKTSYKTSTHTWVNKVLAAAE